MTIAKNHTAGTLYQCQFDWGEACTCQCGDRGMVFQKGTLQQALTEPEAAIAAITGATPHYVTAFCQEPPPA